ncbi:MAG: alpha-D-xyloside xylohydrolase, partial [Myxococcota bacterium]
MTRTNVVIVIGLTLAGCQGDAQPEEPVADFGADIVPSVDPGAPPPETGVTILEQAGFSLRVEYQPFALVLRRGTADLLRIRGSELQIGSVPAYDPVASYDPWPRVSQDPLYTPIPDLVWSSVLDATPTDPSDASAGFELSLEGDLTASLLIVNTAPGRYRLDVTLPQEPNVVFVRMTTRTDAAEGFYGLGEYFDDVNHRGKTRAMQVELDPMVESFNNEAHVPVPLLIGSTGWGLFVPSF